MGQVTATWSDICSVSGLGIATFPTCASAKLTVFSNGAVDLWLWNLSGRHSTYANSIYTAVGLGNLDPSLWSFTNLTVKTPSGSNYSGWSVATGGGGIPGPSPAIGLSNPGSNDGIVSSAFTGPAQSHVTTPWTDGDFANGGVHFQFTAQFKSVTCTGVGRHQDCNTSYTPKFFDPRGVTLDLHVQSGPGGKSTGYACAPTQAGASATCTGFYTPEPTTGVLLGTGVFGILGAGFFRRRRRIQR
jgi:hypothetical protein